MGSGYPVAVYVLFREVVSIVSSRLAALPKAALRIHQQITVATRIEVILLDQFIRLVGALRLDGGAVAVEG
jgi:hypothetical protein